MGIGREYDRSTLTNVRDTMHKNAMLWIGMALLLLVLGGGYLVLQERAPAVIAAPPLAPGLVAAPPPPPAAEPAVRYPLDGLAEASRAALPAADKLDAYVSAALYDLLGQKSVLSMLQTDASARRVVATVDNLAREHAASRLWPVNPTPGRFSVIDQGGSQVLDSANARRYLPFIQMVEAVDLARAVALYARLYPLFQRAYEDLGYPGRYFNDRLVEVLDHLIAAPEPSGPVTVRITEVKGPYKSTRPWLNYEFADPALRSLSSGQKILVRLGRENEQRVKARLVEIRRLVTAKSSAK